MHVTLTRGGPWKARIDNALVRFLRFLFARARIVSAQPAASDRHTDRHYNEDGCDVDDHVPDDAAGIVVRSFAAREFTRLLLHHVWVPQLLRFRACNGRRTNLRYQHQHEDSSRPFRRHFFVAEPVPFS